MDSGRLKRREEISKALRFIQSSLAYPDPEGYQDFLTGLVCNLLEEGNALFKDRSWEEAMKEFSEGLNVSQYAASEDIHIPKVLMESLHVNRAATYYNMQEYEQGVEDCDKALSLCKESRRALYRKALCLKELGKYKEAYSCTTDCLLINRMDSQVNELAQDLAIHLGLKIRKPYISVKEESLVPQTVTANGTTPHEQMCMEHKVESKATATTDQVRSPPPVSSAPEMADDSELIGDDLDSLLDAFPKDSEPMVHLQAFMGPGFMSSALHAVPARLPEPTPQLPAAFFNSTGSQLNNFNSFLGHDRMPPTLDALDDVSTSAGLSPLRRPSGTLHGTEMPKAVPAMAQNSLDHLDSQDDLSRINTKQDAPIANHISEKSFEEALEAQQEFGADLKADPGSNPVHGLHSLDALDLFPSMGNVAATVGAGMDSLSDFTLNGGSDCLDPAPRKIDKDANNGSPHKESKGLTSTHQFMQACSACFFRTGKGIYTFVHKTGLMHSCDKDILLCRKKDSVSPWTRVRPLPLWTSFSGPFVLCKEILQSGDLGLCKFGENCTFAFNQLEVDVWTEERKGTFRRDLLFDKRATKMDPVKGVIQILEENKGMFIFLCGMCFDGKPTIISKRSKDDHRLCSNADARHSFEANKCLAFVIGNITVRYKKVRLLHLLRQLDLCRHSRHGCRLGDECVFAHSDVELKTWKLQRETGTTPDEMVKVSTTYYETHNKDFSYKQHHSIKPLSTGKPKGARPRESLNMRMKFVCGHCWRDGAMSDPDPALKYCSAKAKHMWTKDKRIFMVKSLERSKWVMVRSLPHCERFPLHYDICHRISKYGKCNVGNCTFAHSQEEKDMWTYMKDNMLVDMQQVYDMWLTLRPPSLQKDGPAPAQPPPEEKCIVMPTDYAEPMDGFHCRLCGKHSNSERQWQQHVSSEKHKDRVFTCDEEDKALTWSYRFPAKYFQLCPRFSDHCPDGVSCDYAHGPEELQEWFERRDFLKRKLERAREDMLIMPDESDFGKYNFLLQD